MRFFQTLRRLAYVSRVLAAYWVSFLTSSLPPRFTKIARFFRVEPWSPARLCSMFEELGGTFLKFGQVLALQPDVIPMEYCNALFNLMDRVAPFSYEAAERTFMEEVGSRPEDVFEKFDRRPLATASIGQVHLAVYRGRKYAVKIQRPGVETEFHNDIRLMTTAIRLVEMLHIRSLHWIVEPLSEFVRWTREELDYRCEARYMKQLARNAGDSRRERIPECLDRITTRRTMASEFLEGVTVLDYLRALETNDNWELHRLKAGGFDPNLFAGNVVQNFLGDAFGHGMFHADLHPANLIILAGSVVGYIDFGITAVLSSYSRRHLVALTLAYARGDLDGMCTAFFKVSDLSHNADPAGFRRGLDGLSANWYGTPGEGPRLRKSITLMMMDLLTLSRQTGIWPERDVIKYIRSAIALDGLIKRFAPEFDVGLQLEQICDEQIRASVRKSVLSARTLVDLSSESLAFANEGIFRAGRMLQLLSEGEFSVRVDEAAGTTNSSTAVVRLSAVALLVSVIAVVWGGDERLGLNLFTAAAGIVAASILTLIYIEGGRAARGM
jgi:ubiquinone biosynthesis protein